VVDERQAERLLKLKALFDSGAITKKEFEDAKQSILSESPVTTGIQNTTGVQTRPPQPNKLKIFGILGLLTLIMPLDVVTWAYNASYLGSYTGLSIDWHFFSLAWFGEYFDFVTFMNYLSGGAFEFFIVLLIGFVLVLVGSIMLLIGQRWGGILLIGSIVSWIVPYVLNFQYFPDYSSYVSIPVGAMICVIVGIVSLIYKASNINNVTNVKKRKFF